MARVAVSSNSLFKNVPARPAVQTASKPRIVWNRITKQYARYSDAFGWTQNTTDPHYTWGYDVDGGQWVEFSTAGAEQVFASLPLIIQSGQTYILSMTVESKTGTLSARNFQIAGQSSTPTGTWNVTDPALGRHALVFKANSSEQVTIRVGIGTNTANTEAATLRVSNIMVEIPDDSTRTYPYEYVTPGDQRAYNYAHTNTMSGTLAGTPTLGEAYDIPVNCSVMVIGDSFTDTEKDIEFSGGTTWGDFPRQMRRLLPQHRYAVNTRGVAGTQIREITTQLSDFLAETQGATDAAPIALCIAEGGINDMIIGSRTLEQMKADKLTQIAAIEAAGMRPVLVNIGAWDGYVSWSSDRQTQTIAYNAWLETLCYPLYDLYADSDDGTGTIKTAWGSSDGLHPGTSYTNGQSIIAQRVSDLIRMIGG